MRLGPKKIILLIRWPQSAYRSLSVKGLVKKVYRAFITDTNQIRPFSSVPPYGLDELSAGAVVGLTAGSSLRRNRTTMHIVLVLVLRNSRKLYKLTYM